jgi:branched-chain amino acid transport system permease protein
MDFFWLLLVNGLLVGTLYALIALGFVLIYKATDAINFAQGEMVMLAGFILVAALKLPGGSLLVAILISLAAMFLFGFAVERVMLRPLVGRPVVAMIMATIGLASVLKGLGPMLWGAETKNVPLPIRDEPIVLFNIPISPVSLLAAAVSLLFLAGFGLFFLRSRTGIAMRAVADDQPAAMAMGINVGRYFGLAWALAGIVSAVGGIIWGNLLGVDVHLALVGFKVFPVIILGGIDSIPGAVLGGLIVGVVEGVSAGYIDPYVGGGSKDFIPYLLMIVALMIRPYGIFGEEIIERV